MKGTFIKNKSIIRLNTKTYTSLEGRERGKGEKSKEWRGFLFFIFSTFRFSENQY